MLLLPTIISLNIPFSPPQKQMLVTLCTLGAAAVLQDGRL